MRHPLCARLSLAGAPLLPALVLFACEPHGEVVVVVPGPPPPVVIHEVEPNDTPQWPMALGPLSPGDQLILLGHASAWSDPYDGFAFAADGGLLVEFQLVPTAGFGDLDLLVYDPWSESIVAAYDSPSSHESGAILVSAGGEFHLVVAAFAGSQSYELHVQAYPAYGVAAAADREEQEEAPVRALDAPGDSAPERIEFQRRYLERDPMDAWIRRLLPGALLSTGE